MAHVLLVVPDSDLRKSLEFALRADGHVTSWRSSLDESPIPIDFDCTILDHHAVGLNLKQGEVFCRAFWPVILLANTEGHPLAKVAFCTVLKPLLGPVLSTAINDALAVRSVTT